MATWNQAKDDELRTVYPRAAWSAIEAALPGHTRSSIFHRAFALGVKREQREVPPEIVEAHRVRLRGGIRTGKFLHPVVVRDGVDGKVCSECSECREFRPLAKFSRQADCAGGRKSICTTCEGRVAYATNPAARIATVRRYQKNHPAKAKLIKFASRRIRNERMLVGPGVTTAQLRAKWAEHDGLCAYCPAVATTNDHVVPLSRGGFHEIGNIVPACRTCNMSKHDKTPEEWRQARS